MLAYERKKIGRTQDCLKKKLLKQKALEKRSQPRDSAPGYDPASGSYGATGKTKVRILPQSAGAPNSTNRESKNSLEAKTDDWRGRDKALSDKKSSGEYPAKETEIYRYTAGDSSETVAQRAAAEYLARAKTQKPYKPSALGRRGVLIGIRAELYGIGHGLYISVKNRFMR